MITQSNNNFNVFKDDIFDLKCELFYNDFKNPFSDKYLSIYKFILENIIPKYDSLESCNVIYEYDENDIEFINIKYYIRFLGELSFKERKKIHQEIIIEIYDFCNNSGFSEAFEDISIFILKKQ